MRIWDISPGYLNHGALLAEHRDIHEMVSILDNDQAEHSRHPELLRWSGYGWALKQRQLLLEAELGLRGDQVHSPVDLSSNRQRWPDTFIDQPGLQFELIRSSHDKESGRIPLPNNAQQLWSQHKYSVMARDNALYKSLGKKIATLSPGTDFSALATELSITLRQSPPAGGIQNALLHMWGHVADFYSGDKSDFEKWPLNKLLHTVQLLAIEHDEPYLKASTSLAELGSWL